MDVTNKTYVVTINIMKEKYYLASLSGTISRCVSDSLIFANENVAYFYATKVENIYPNSLGRIELVAFHELF